MDRVSDAVVVPDLRTVRRKAEPKYDERHIDELKKTKEISLKILDKMRESEVQKALADKNAAVTKQDVSLEDLQPPTRRTMQKVKTKLRNKYEYIARDQKPIRIPQNAIDRKGFSYYGLGEPFPDAISWHQAMTEGKPVTWERDEVSQAVDGDSYNNWRARTQWDSRRLVRCFTSNTIFPDELI